MSQFNCGNHFEREGFFCHFFGFWRKIKERINFFSLPFLSSLPFSFFFSPIIFFDFDSIFILLLEKLFSIFFGSPLSLCFVVCDLFSLFLRFSFCFSHFCVFVEILIIPFFVLFFLFCSFFLVLFLFWLNEFQSSLKLRNNFIFFVFGGRRGNSDFG